MTYNEIRSSRCTRCSHDSEIVVSEKKSRYQLNNPGKKLVCVTKIDGCFVVQQLACDYLITDCHDYVAYFIELKGSDVYRAYDQIQHSLFQIKDKLNGYICHARIVPTRVSVPDIRNDPKTITFRKLIKSFGGDLKIKEKNMTE
jgi:hypothetical protein